MKVLFVFALIVAAVFAEPQCKHPSGGGLPAALKEFVDLIPVEKVLGIYLEAVSSDEEVQAVMEHLGSDDFIELVNAVHFAPQYNTLVKAACDTLFFDAQYYLDYIGDIVGWPKVSARFHKSVRGSPGVRGLVDDILAAIPLEKILALLDEKLASDEFCKLGLNVLQSKDFVSIVRVVRNHSQYKFVESELRRMKIDMDAVIAFLEEHLGWTMN